mmetsp:Transcript_11446/g.31705  ORF Transcript_11446/g.31705 Transcript_11446/m.31705 type:complete len:358 (-) Transcript_11446:563-1636(-)|eukprot:CAMPEP_0198131846 /NCGR_PEP_ID=MMETSP1442-20131203/57058_1 /TAXON_ID= /ORGANISM="Craspedostauros australis, Strain CCMP3328" /LENGTH=357 /DNA_ID=CAMNT_0043792727 /DNA_START=321 /DNA_END=1394 /DNA_ORIENTATION=+
MMKMKAAVLLPCLAMMSHSVTAFQKPALPTASRSSFLQATSDDNKQRVQQIASFDPFHLEGNGDIHNGDRSMLSTNDGINNAAPTTAALLTAMVVPSMANAAAVDLPALPSISSGQFDPSKFQPVCSASDGFYRFLQQGTQAVVGPEAFTEYGPLIAGGLLRIRLELCVVESFFNEAVGPFIQQNGLSWILPLHETVETFLAGVVFSLATTFILVGSTKILTVIFTYADFLLGAPCRLLGGFTFDRATGKPVTLDFGVGPFKTRVLGPKAEEMNTDERVDLGLVLSERGLPALLLILLSGGIKAVGTTVGFARSVLDAIDLFVGRYLVLWVTAYIGLKFLHFKVFPDFPDFPEFSAF